MKMQEAIPKGIEVTSRQQCIKDAVRSFNTIFNVFQGGSFTSNSFPASSREDSHVNISFESSDFKP
jgi:hypothetical protein